MFILRDETQLINLVAAKEITLQPKGQAWVITVFPQGGGKVELEIFEDFRDAAQTLEVIAARLTALEIVEVGKAGMGLASADLTVERLTRRWADKLQAQEERRASAPTIEIKEWRGEGERS